MEQIVTWQSPKKIGIFLGSLLLLFGLLNITSLVRSPVTFPDPNFEAVIRDKLGKDTGLIYEEELLTITELDAASQGISHIDGIEYLSRLVFLNLADNAVEDLSPLAELSILTELDLRNNPISDLDAVNFAAITHLPLRELDLSNDVGGHHPRVTDITLFGNFTQLESLDLRGNHVQDLSPLADLRALTELNLRDNYISDLAGVNFASIAHLPLRQLNLRDNIAESGARLSDIELLGDLTQLESLNLRDNHIQDLAPLTFLTSLSSLNLRGNQVSDLVPLQTLSALNELNLRENALTDLAPLSALTNLEYLNIHSNPVNAGFEALTNLPGLHTLIMRNVALGEHVVYLDNLDNLQRLNLRNTGIANTQPLGFMRQLEQLDLRDNFINDISAFSTLTSLKALDLANNQVRDIQALRPLTNMQDLNLSGNAVADIGPLAGMTDLAELNMDGNPTVTGFEALGNLEQLQSLNLSNAALGTNVNYLANLTSLEHLNLRNTGIPSVDLLGEMTELQTLDLRANHISDITALTTLTHLQELDLRDNHVFDIAPLAELYAIELLNLRGNTVGDLTPLGALTNLVYLNVHSNPVESGVEALANLSALDTLILRDVWLGADVAVLENLTQVVRLNLRNTGIADVQPLAGMAGLVELDLGENNLQDLTELAALTNLTALDLRANQVSDLNPLQNLVNLQVLNLDGNTVRDLTSLAGMSALTELSLADNQISRLNAVNFGEINHLSLTHLNLGDNVTGLQSGLADLELLGGLNQLTVLDLRSNQLSDLAPLGGLTALQVLNLAENQVADLAPLAELLALTELDLAGNHIADLVAVNFYSITRLPLAHLNLSHNADQDGNQLADITLVGELTGLTALVLRGNQVEDLAPLLALTGLKELDLRENMVADVNSLATLIHLEHLDMRHNQVVDISPLGGLDNLVTLDLRENQIEGISALGGLASLIYLNLRENQVVDICALGNMTNLIYLNLHSNPVEGGFEALAGLTGLQTLLMRNVEVGEGVQYLAHLSNLTRLNLTNSDISDVMALANLSALEALDLRDNDVWDIYALAGNTQLAVLDLRQNHIVDIEPLQSLTNLTELNIRQNRVTDLSPLESLTNLVYLNLHSNPVEVGLPALANLDQLETLIMRNVSIGDEFQFLSSLAGLQRLNIRNSSISDVTVIGDLMASGALQDDPQTGSTAVIDLLQIDPTSSVDDPYLELRRYWDNITYRFPITLPYYPSQVAGPIFSHKSGFYQEGFDLAITTLEPDGRIFYTLDGSPPALTPDLQPMLGTFEYSNPLQLELDGDVLRQYSNVDVRTRPLHHHTPENDIFRAYVIRVIVIDRQGKRSNMTTLTFFLDGLMDERYTMPVVSIVTDPKGLFDDEVGIYTLGDLYEDLDDEMPWLNPANYRQRGLKWERPASFQIYSPNGDILIDQVVGIRIHGGGSKHYQQKSLRVYARNDYDHLSHIEINLFPALDYRLHDDKVDIFRTLILRNSGNDWSLTMFRDAMAHSLLEHTKLDIQGYKPVIVLINGEYWGIHNIRNRFDESYFETYYGIMAEELTVLFGSVFRVKRGDQSGSADFFNLLQMIDPNLEDNQYRTVNTLADQTFYEEIAARIDVKNFINHYLAQIYFRNLDWPHNNNPFWRKLVDPLTVNPDASYGHDGKWRWMINDVDFGFHSPEDNTLTHATEDDVLATFLMRALLQNDGFRTKFINNFADHLNTSFREAVVVEHINTFEALYFPEIDEHIHRWGQLGGSIEGWLSNVQVMREFAKMRPTYQRQHILEYFNLPGTATLTTTADPAQGHIRINSIDVQPGAVGVEDTNRWQGIYFQGIPIEMTAVQQPGYRFVRWVGLEGLGLDSTSANLVFELPGDIHLTAVFERE